MDFIAQLKQKEDELQQAIYKLQYEEQWLRGFDNEITLVEQNGNAMRDFKTRQLMQQAREIGKTHSLGMILTEYMIKTLTREVEQLKAKVPVVVPDASTAAVYTGPITRQRAKLQQMQPK